MNKLEQTVSAMLIPTYRFVKKLGVDKYESDDTTSYVLKLYIVPDKLKNYLDINPNFFDKRGNLKAEYKQKAFNNFTTIVDDDGLKNQNVAKNLFLEVKKIFYLARKMSGSDYSSGPVSLRIVFI